MYEFILFDLDGTLTESGQGIVNSVVYALKKMGIEENDKANLDKFVGPPLLDSFMKYYDFTEEDAKKAIIFYREYFTEKGIYEAPLYEGIETTLKYLKDSVKTLYVATSKPEVYARRILQHLQVENYFADIVGSNLDGTKVNKDEIISFLLEKNGITDKSKVLMVGDREHDIFGAKKVGVDSVGVLYGYGDYQELESAGATYIIEKLDDIIEMVL